MIVLRRVLIQTTNTHRIALTAPTGATLPLDVLRRLHRFAALGLLIIWLLMGASALAEQADILSETSSQDERALSRLVLAIKPGQIEAGFESSTSPVSAIMISSGFFLRLSMNAPIFPSFCIRPVFS